MGCFEGYNAAVLAYGQTGSKIIAILGGKTYTMGTNTTRVSRQSFLLGNLQLTDHRPSGQP